MPSLNISRLAR